eukprot:7993794-Pyramimonas_sp.AAC.1
MAYHTRGCSNTRGHWRGLHQIIKGQEELFAAIVPESSTRALSKYTDMVDTLYRELGGALQAMQEGARLVLLSLELPELLQVSLGLHTDIKPLITAFATGEFVSPEIF